MTLVRTTWMKPQGCKKVGIRSVSCSNPARYKNGYGVTFFCPPDDSARSPSSFPPECRSGRRRKQQAKGGGRGRRSSDPSALSPLLSSRPVLLLLLCCNFFFLSIVLPQIQFVVCDSRRDFTGAPCAYKKKPGAICCKIGSYFVPSVSIYCCCCCCWSWVVF